MSNNQTELTTIWNDGEVHKTDRFGRTRQLRNTIPAGLIGRKHDQIADVYFRKKDGFAPKVSSELDAEVEL